ncbi:hypothetical protein ATCC90586_005152 [Pythium insidiosum]|nr:hypothetical protein ATCC90586_005152 [Pythium insidiosum]
MLRATMPPDATPIMDGVLPIPPELSDLADSQLPAIVLSVRANLPVLEYWLFVEYLVMAILCALLLAYLRYNQHIAFRGDANAARKVLLPAFEPLLWLLTAVTALLALSIALVMRWELFESARPQVLIEVCYSGRQFVFLLVLVFLFQKCVSRPALGRAVMYTLALSTHTIPFAWLVAYRRTPRNSIQLYWMHRVSRGLVLFFYAYVIRRPPTRASVRTVRELCVFALLYSTLLFASNALFKQDYVQAGYVMTYIHLAWASLCPMVIWRVLRADTDHWRGLSQRVCSLDSNTLMSKPSRLHERISSQGFHVLIEMHRKYVIDFASLEIRQRIGVGSSAVVFNGVLRSHTPVAIKMYTPADLTDDTIAQFSHEAALSGALTSHPNIVTFHGLCISPPTICLVSELCQGNLSDVTTTIAREYAGLARPSLSGRRQFLINLGYMLDAARAVAFLHSFTPPFLHRDIKPSNFLVDAKGTVKLTDFGESRALARGSSVGSGLTSMLEGKASLSTATKIHTMPESPTAFVKKMTVRGTVDYMAPELITGKAGVATYGEAADVYALGITMWDILYPDCDKYPETGDTQHLKVFEQVLAGGRPLLDPTLAPQLRVLLEKSWHPEPRRRPSAQRVVAMLERIQEDCAAVFAFDLLDALTQDGESSDGDIPMVSDDDESFGRPDSAAVVDMHIDEDDEDDSGSRCRNYVSAQDDTSDSSVSGGKRPKAVGEKRGVTMAQDAYSGAMLCDHMRAIRAVRSVDEALRLGHALMDAGLLHHTKHSSGFLSTDNSSYYFDEDRIERAVFAAPTDLSASVSSDSALARRRPRKLTGSSLSSQPIGTSDNAMCRCRKLGQQLSDAGIGGAGFRSTRRGFLRFRRKFHAIAEENVLTTNLLLDDEHSLSRNDHAFDEFPTGTSIV